jgi:alkylation response protein AidB-like acyl-CoA dehydrogenase
LQRTIFEAEHDAFREAVKAFIARELLPFAHEHREQKCIPRHVWRRAGEAGFLGFMMPAEFGGGGTSDFRFNAVLGEELARLGYAYSSAIGINVDVVSTYLRDLTTPEQKARWLPCFCTGETITAIAMTEPGAGSDLAGIATTAAKTEGGWMLNGSKTFITNGAEADLIIVAAKSDPNMGARGITLFVVERGAGGFSRGTKLDKIGQPEASATELFFSNVFVPDADVLGQPGEGFAAMMRGLAQERLSAAVAAVADAFAVFDETLAYVRERHAFGASIGSFQHNKFQIATMATELDITRAWVDRCIEAHVAGDLSAVDAAKAKYWSTEVENRVIDGCLQLFGGYGYMREYRVARAWIDARVTRIFAGTNEIMREVIGRSFGL